MDSTTDSQVIFKASLGVFPIIITTFVFIMCIGGVVLIFTVPPWFGGLFLFLMSVILIVFFYLYSIKAYVLTNDKLVIKRPFSRFDKEILLSDISSAKLGEKADFKWTIRAAGNGGLFGYSGSFVNNQLGTFTMYATSNKNRTIIKLKHPAKTIVITPDDTTFVDALQKILH